MSQDKPANEKKKTNEEKNDQKDANNPDGDKNNNEPKEKTFTLKSLHAVGTLANYLGEFSYLELAEPIKDINDKILVQKNITLRNSIYETLKARPSEELPGHYVFKFNNTLKKRYKAMIAKKLYSCLEGSQFHIANELMKISTVNYYRITDKTLDNWEILELLIDMDQNDDPLLPHLGETALVSAGFAEQMCLKLNIEENFHKIIKNALTAGLLHDISLQGDQEFLVKDIEKAAESGHEAKSQRIVSEKTPSLDPEISQIIGNHHRTEPIYADKQNSIPTDNVIVSESLNFAEFFLANVREQFLSEERKKNFVDKIFFRIGQAIGEGFFHSMLFDIMGDLQKKFKAILKYGQDIGQVERQCIHGDSAVAYPIPRCSQVLCKNHKTNCEKFIPSYPMQVIHPSKFVQIKQKALPAGQYFKCRLEELLPTPPPEIQ